MNRRNFLRSSAGLTSAIILAACAPKATAPQDAEQPPAADPTQPPAPAPVGERAFLRVGAWEFADRPWMANVPLEYAEQHPEVDVEVEIIIYGEAFTKAMTGAATGTLPDVFYVPVRWGPYAAFKGAFLWLDDLVEVQDPGMDDWFDAVLPNTKWEDKMYALPNELHPGRPTTVYYNRDLLAERGVDEPTDDWTWDEYAEMASKITDEERRIYGSAWFPTNVHDYIAMTRSWGGDLLSEDGRTCTFNTDPNSIATARFQVDMKTVYNAVPGRDEREGLQFFAGLYGFNPLAPNNIRGITEGVGDNFEWDVVMAPVGTPGLRGGYMFINSFCLSATTQHPDEAYDLAVYMTSYDVMKRALLEEGHNPHRESLWRLPEAHPIWPRAADWLTTTKAEMRWPAPWNLLFEEMQDTFVNNVLPLWYAEVPFEQGMQEIHDAVQAVLDQPRP